MDKANQEMKSAKDALAATSFPKQQWALIKRYIVSAIIYNQIVVGRTVKTVSQLDQPTGQ
jgi:hypothetical protein